MPDSFYFDLDPAWTEIETFIAFLKESYVQFTVGSVIHTINLFDFLCTALIMFSLCTVLFAFRHPNESQ